MTSFDDLDYRRTQKLLVAPGGSLDPEKRRALSSFYREEFLRYLDHFEAAGLLTNGNHRCRQLMSDLDEVCCRAQFPAVAETLLQNFDALARLSPLGRRRSH